jgi:hypothetical protein
MIGISNGLFWRAKNGNSIVAPIVAKRRRDQALDKEFYLLARGR